MKVLIRLKASQYLAETPKMLAANITHRQMLALGRSLKRPQNDKKELDQFRTTIAADRNKFKERLAQGIRKM
jgi:cytochrome c-type biogenesis protein CcmH/NrfF